MKTRFVFGLRLVSDNLKERGDAVLRNYHIVFLSIILLVVSSLPSCTRANESNSNQQEVTPNIIEPIVRVKERLIAQYNPIILPIQAQDTGFYTLQLQQQLIGTRSVLFMGQIVDIWELENQTYIEFEALLLNKFGYDDESMYSSPFWLSSSIFVLQCNYEDIEAFLNVAPQSMFGMILNPEKFYVVAEINSIAKTDFKVVGLPEDENTVSIELEVSDKYILNGKLIDLVGLSNIANHDEDTDTP